MKNTKNCKNVISCESLRYSGLSSNDVLANSLCLTFNSMHCVTSGSLKQRQTVNFTLDPTLNLNCYFARSYTVFSVTQVSGLYLDAT